ncbi:MAG: VOC family protein [Bacteroidia bacterium]
MNNCAPYLFFNGNCEEAMNFYKECLGGKLDIMHFSEMPGGEVNESDKKRVMHATLTSGGIMFMASDSDSQHGDIPFGANVFVNINTDDVETADSFYTKLSAGGQATMPMENTFWGAKFGMLTDKYGQHWMINCELKK